MEKQLFVGREEHLARLKNLLDQASQNQGSVVFIEGETGMGKSELLTVMQEPGYIKQSSFENARFVFGFCYEDNGSQNAYQPLVEILGTLTKTEHKSSNIAKFFLSVVKETGPDWLQIIPGIGPVISAGIKTAIIASNNWLLNANSDQLTNASELASQYTNTIIKIASRYKPLVFIVEDAHWIDQASCQVLLRLARKIRNQPLVIILTYRPSFIDEAHPLRMIMREIHARNLAHTISLTSLTQDQIQNYILARFGVSIGQNLAAWLTHLCNGNPLFVSQYLSLLEETQILQRDGESYKLNGKIDYSAGNWHPSVNIPIPDSVEAVLEQRIQRLVENDRQMLQNAAVQGENFMSSVLSELLKINELDLLPRLRAIVEQHHLIRYGLDTNQWSNRKDEIYTFEHVLMHRVFYNRLSPRERVLYHRRVAEILENSNRDSTDLSRKLLIEIALHYDLGDVPLSASRYYYLAAKSSFASGAFKETSNLCQSALEKVRSIRDQDKLYSEIIQLLLSASEMWIRGRSDIKEELPLALLAEESVSAAKRTDDKVLLAQALFLKGRLLIATKGLSEAIGAMNNALDLAHGANDTIGEFVIMSYLGYITKAENFAQGMNLSYQAYDLYKERLEKAQNHQDTESLKRQFNRLQGFIGVGEFDRGNFDEALKWLNKSISNLRKLKMQDDLLRMYNFLGQVYIAIGLFEDAESIIKESIHILKDEDEPNPWKGYNLALLGKLYIEWQRLEDAEKPILKGWQETQSTWNVDIVRLVRIYFIELLMHPSYKSYDLSEAKNQLEIEIDETLSSGFHDTAIIALSLQGQLELKLGKIEAATNYSNQAIQYLEKMGTKLPALRAEEIFFNHYLVLSHNPKQSNEASANLEKAHKIIQQKVATLENTNHQLSYLERVPLNRAIRLAINKSGI